MINLPLDQIDKDAIQQFIANKVQESKTLEYKLELPRGTDGAVKEFLADVSSFANVSGGDILYGVKEEREADGSKTGKPEAAVGLEGVTGDEMTRRLDSMIRDGLAPRLNVQIRAIEGFEKGPLILLRIPKTWQGPHMITKGESRFFSRTNAGKYPLDIQEIRNAIALSESLSEKIRNWRDGRLMRIVAGETALSLGESPKIVLHLLPVSALVPAASIRFEAVSELTSKLRPIGVSGWDYRINFDGFLAYAMYTNEPVGYVYTQLFRTGAIEAVNASILAGRGERREIPHVSFEHKLMAALKCYLSITTELEIQPPIFVMLSLTGVRGFVMSSDDVWTQFDRHPIDRDTLILPDLLVEDLNEKPEAILQPAFDALWQASGFPRSPNYDADGKRVR